MIVLDRRPRKRQPVVLCRAAFVGVAFLAGSALAARQRVAEASLALDQRDECRFDVDGSTECVDTFRYTILSEAGREALSRVDIDYSENDRVEIERAEVIQPGQKPVALIESQIDTRMAPNPDQGFRRHKQTSLAFPNLRVGSTIVYSVRTRYAAVPIATQFGYSLAFRPTPIRFDRIHMEFSADRPIKVRSEKMDDFTITPSADAKKLTVDLKAPRFESYVDEPDNGFVRLFPRLELGSSLDLQENIGPFARRFNEILAAPLPARAAAAAAKAASLPPRQRVSALMQYLNDNFRYLSDWRASERGFVPFSLSEIEQHSYGDCKDLSTLLIAMLRASGLKAEPVYVQRGITASSLLAPSIHAFNHAIVRAEVDGAVWWLDPTNPVFEPGAIMSDLQERWAFVLGADGRVRQEDIPAAALHTGFDVTLKESLSNGEQGNIDATVALGGDTLMQLAVSDRDAGKTSGDNELCQIIAMEPSQCNVKRGATGFLIPDTYLAQARAVDLRALETRAGTYTYSRPRLLEVWDSFARYKRNGQLSDLYFGSPETMKLNVMLSAKATDGQPHTCSVRSRWYDVDLSGKPMPDGYQFSYSLSRKVSWFAHSDIVSAEFQKIVQQSRDCVRELQFAVQPKTS
jgi:transglutaminase-like putative cysteine protease